MIFKLIAITNGVKLTSKASLKDHISYVAFIRQDGLTRFATRYPQRRVDYDYQNRCKVVGIDEL